MTNSKIKKILLKIEEIKILLNSKEKNSNKKNKHEINAKTLRVLKKTLNYLKDK